MNLLKTTSKDGPAKDEPAKDGPAKDGPAKDESAKDESAKDGHHENSMINDDIIDPVTNTSLEDRFKVPWNKLEKGMKMNRIIAFIRQETLDKGLSDSMSKDLKSILFNACDRGLFNKISDVSYNIDTGLIESFKCLEYNESSKKYKLKSNGAKNRSVSKSRSNIDRLQEKKLKINIFS